MNLDNLTIEEVRANQLADIRARLAARTQGSWVATLDNDGWCVSSVPDEGTAKERMETLARLGSGSPASDTADACFIASAPDDIALLLAEVERLTQRAGLAFLRGVSAMREAAARQVTSYNIVVKDPWGRAFPVLDSPLHTLAEELRALPTPEDK